jgi:hypothetical protein
MKLKFQVSLRNSLIATSWAAVFCANWAVARRSLPYRELLDGWVMVTFIYAPPSAIVGALAGRPLLGVLCGLAGVVAIITWISFDPIYTL